MIVKSYVIKKDVLVDSEYELLCNVSGAWNAESSFAINRSDIQDSLDITIELDNGEEVTDCQGRTLIPDYDSEINFMRKLLKESEDCEYIIVQFDYEPQN